MSVTADKAAPGGYRDSLDERGGTPRLSLTPDERAAIAELTDVLLDDPFSGEPEQRLHELVLAAHSLPVRLRAVLTEFRLTGRPLGGLLISGLPVDDLALPRTPTSYTEVPYGREVSRAGLILLLLGSALGDPFSFVTQQQGKLILDVFPVRGHEQEQLGSSSTVNLEWHNEDAFHEHRADWLLLLGMRNHDDVATTFAPIQDIRLEPEHRKLLFQERYVILPDESHSASFNAATTGLDADDRIAEAFARVAEMNAEPRKIPILSGDPDAPFVRIDPAFMQPLQDAEAQQALDMAIDAIDARLRDVVLYPGDLMIVDNKRAVHGRRPFKARYDGTDRWMRRINVTAHLRNSAGRLHGPLGRAVL
ncbi:guanitoxin biosynthesis L-enduracididine beta-hydroxylase GntD [Amycolatopsis australiensis]|uniref:Arginine beta-hydroxylase, Fe(II)/alpha-ketoglutarate-dependent n=1 Tax=Amycolatopsis australiensis TaxID=546364 RepID=A0A1K1RLN6_9PSEU|nr:guanitoxin biosynthesis L-enduracididine beta-hydroxylase GntD [Amycolatopsis australiensis]SFW72993.1 arginine beta-hydroxylase, Fe(II)/alpha-ketoglutarate-dependent [Amycolatopsis australiensis]